MYLGWNLNTSNLPAHSSAAVTIVIITLSVIQAFLPGIFCAQIVFPVLRKKTKAEKVNVTVLLLLCLLLLFGSLNVFGIQHPSVFLFTLSLGFLGIKLVEISIETFYANES